MKKAAGKLKPNREIEATFIIRLKDDRTEEVDDRGETELSQMVDAIAVAIDDYFKKGGAGAKCKLAEITEVRRMEDREPTEMFALAEADEGGIRHWDPKEEGK